MIECRPEQISLSAQFRRRDSVRLHAHIKGDELHARAGMHYGTNCSAFFGVPDVRTGDTACTLRSKVGG